MLRKGAKEDRNELSDLLDAAEKVRSTIITRHGRPVAAWCPSGPMARLFANRRSCRCKDPVEAYGGRTAPTRSASCVTNGADRNSKTFLTRLSMQRPW
jgi:antitoxin (DNA-binding transcriptional repressor) of toxin-antitoxin stability system